MKKILAFLTAFVMFIITIVCFHNMLSGDLRMNNRDFGTWYNNYKDLSYNGLIQNMHYDTMPVFGSSEFRHGRKTAFHPRKVFKDSDATIMTIGGPYNQCLNHAITLGAISNKIKKKKVVLLISMSWFFKGGITGDRYALRFSEGNYMAFMDNPKISKEVKEYVAKRSESLLTGDIDKLRFVKRTDHIKLDGSKLLLENLAYDINKAYVDDKDLLVMQSLMKQAKIKRNSSYPKLSKTVGAPDWSDLLLKARRSATKSYNNDYYMDAKFWNRHIGSKYKAHKDNLQKETLTDSPEFADLEAFLKICKEEKIKPMLVVLPVNGKWYDYKGVDGVKRSNFTNKIYDYAKKYNAEAVEFSKYEYMPNIIKDAVHPGSEGWVRINEAIYNFYH